MVNDAAALRPPQEVEGVGPDRAVGGPQGHVQNGQKQARCPARRNGLLALGGRGEGQHLRRRDLDADRLDALLHAYFYDLRFGFRLDDAELAAAFEPSLGDLI
jgi:hypothetical protein